ncbi:peptide ABC transporter permease [Chelativorans sp. Marseille-P2723]|uniref:peptide ABC transporter permease n=1 Tax=Chelativorans sp. Marseille-P2723 TaxID=2709133 RepID=UPI00156DE16D|nr:peptide ABC transporter permease [Chelativorans sp. Marseille-P2723]
MADKPKPLDIPSKEASQGFIVLRTPLRRAIFIGGLAGIVVLAIALMLGSPG